MKTLFKITLVFALCFAVLCERNLGFQADSFGVVIQNQVAPYFKISQGGSIYLMNLKSIYEIYQDPTTSQWTKDYTTETTLDKLSWNITADLLKGNAALLGAPCPCQNPQEPLEEPFPVTRSVGRTVRDDPFENLVCSHINFGYLRFVFQNVAGENNTECTPVDLGMCTTTCGQFCSNATNPTNCNTGCAAITSASTIDTNVCYTTCNISGTEDVDCLNGCMNMVDCIAEYSCRLDIGYHLHSYQWSNSTSNSNASRKLAFAFEIVPEPAEGQPCGSEAVTWLKGPFLLWINTTTLTVQHQDGCVDCPPDVASAVVVPSVVNIVPGASSVIGRFYVDNFTSGYSAFNPPVEIVDAIPTTSR